MPKTISMTATSHSERKTVSIWSWNSSPSTTIGMLPMMISQPIRASGSLRGTLPNSERNHCATMRTMSRQKNTTTAASVPICVIAVNAAPGSSARRQERAEDAQMRAGGDGQELGESLDEAQDDRFEQVHGGAF